VAKFDCAIIGKYFMNAGAFKTKIANHKIVALLLGGSYFEDIDVFL
jgi:hypothetical protein